MNEMSDKKLKTLEDHNREALKRIRIIKEGIANGIACPECNEELRDIPGIIFLTDPPKYEVRCVNPDCGWKGARF